MITFKKILAFCQSFSSPHPLRDWLTLLVLLLTLLAILFATSLHYFFGINSGSIISAPDANIPQTARISRTELKEIVDAYAQRRVNFEAGEITIPDISDPSL